MSTALGDKDIKNIYYGTTPIVEVRYGTELYYSKTYTVTINQTDTEKERITVTAGGVEYTESFECPYNTKITSIKKEVIKTSDLGYYTAGSVSGSVSESVSSSDPYSVKSNISITIADTTFTYHKSKITLTRDSNIDVTFSVTKNDNSTTTYTNPESFECEYGTKITAITNTTSKYNLYYGDIKTTGITSFPYTVMDKEISVGVSYTYHTATVTLSRNSSVNTTISITKNDNTTKTYTNPETFTCEYGTQITAITNSSTTLNSNYVNYSTTGITSFPYTVTGDVTVTTSYSYKTSTLKVTVGTNESASIIVGGTTNTISAGTTKTYTYNYGTQITSFTVTPVANYTAGTITYSGITSIPSTITTSSISITVANATKS